MKRSYKILVIEDDDSWISILSNILQTEGWRVTVCKDLQEAIEALSRELFHFATVDLKLVEDAYHSLELKQEWSGWQVLGFIKNKSINPAMGAMVISAYASNDIINKAMRDLGALDFMSKRDFDSVSFVNTLKLYLETYHDKYFYEGIVQKSMSTNEIVSLTETEKFQSAFRSVDGIREYFRRKKETGFKTIIIFSDLCDSTSYKDQRGFVEGLFKSYNHNERVSTILQEYGGTVVKTIGDCVMGRFDTEKNNQGQLTTQAINAAIKIHETFDEMNVGITKDIEKYRSKTGICIGITGDSYMNDPHGLPVDSAARLTSLANPEQILVCKDIMDTANIMQIEAQVLKIPSLRLSPTELVCGPQNRKLKGIEDYVQVCEIKWDGKERGIQESK